MNEDAWEIGRLEYNHETRNPDNPPPYYTDFMIGADVTSQGWECWLPCDGRRVQVTDYPKLFEKLQYIYGGGGDSFQIPDMRSKP